MPRLEPVLTAVYTAGLTYRLYKRSWPDDLKPETPAVPPSNVTEERKKGGWGGTGGNKETEGEQTKRHH